MDPANPYTARHSIGFGPTVAASLYPGEWHREGPGQNYTEAAHLDLLAGQRGQEEPVVDLYLRADKTSMAALGEESLHLSLGDAKDLIKALGYLVDVLEGRREPLQVPA